MALFGKRSHQVSASPPADEWEAQIQRDYGPQVESPAPGGESGVLRLATGGMPTRPIGVEWKAVSVPGMDQLYRGSPQEDAAEGTAKAVAHFEQHLAAFREEGWRIVGIQGRSLLLQRS